MHSCSTIKMAEDKNSGLINLNDEIKEAVFAEILGVPVKMYRPDSHEWQPEVVISGLEPYKYVTFLSQLETSRRQQVLDTIFAPPITVNVCVSPPLPKALDKISGNLWNLNVLFREKLNLQIQSNSTVAQLRSQINESSSEVGESFGLWFGGKPMSDPDCTLAWHGVREGSLIEVRPRFQGGDLPKLVGLNANTFDPGYDFDFTNVDDTGQTFTRGGLEYHRPIGWKRYALNVEKKYEDDKWLGSTGSAESGEWAVSFHGTGATESVQSIVNTGYDPRKTIRNVYGFDDDHKVYSAPLVTTAEEYANWVNCGGSKYKFVFQNRINPKDMRKNDSSVNPYWGAGMDSMRPYGLLVKKTNDPNASTDAPDP